MADQPNPSQSEADNAVATSEQQPAGAEGQAAPDTGNQPPAQAEQQPAGAEGQAQGEGDKPAEGEGNKTDGESDIETAAFAVPEDMKLPEDIASEVKAFAKEHKLSAKDAQKLIDLGVKQRQLEAAAYNKTVEGWVETVKNDPVIGGEKLAENLAVAKSAMREFGDQELVDLLDGTRYGNHPAIVRFMHKVGTALGEDKLIRGEGSPKGENASFYKNSNMQK